MSDNREPEEEQEVQVDQSDEKRIYANIFSSTILSSLHYHFLVSMFVL